MSRHAGADGSSRLLVWLGFAAVAALAGAGIATVLSGGDRHGEVLGAGAPGAVPGSYLVILKDATPELDSTEVNAVTTQLTGTFGGTVRHRYYTAMRGFSVSMSADKAAKLAGDPRVSYVQQNRRFRIAALPPSPAPAARAIQPARIGPAVADPVTAYILDTGIRLSHREFAGRATSGTDTVDGDTDASDCNGHGTAVAGAVGGRTYGVAKNVQLVAVRVLDCAGYGTDATVVAGIDWVTKNAVHPAVANLSLAGPVSPTLHWVLKASIRAGITYTLSAGNGATDACGTAPAHVPDAITVGATGRDGKRALFSNYGSCLDLFAPGTGVPSAGIRDDSATTTRSGTSMAAARVAGAAAEVLFREPFASPQQVRDALVSESAQNTIANPGSGSPNRLLSPGGGAGQAPAQPERPGAPPPSELPLPSPSPKPDPEPGPGVPTRDCGPFARSDRLKLPDPGTATSTITVRDCTGKAAAASQVRVEIQHPRSGDLAVTLIAQDGSQYPLLHADPASVRAGITVLMTVDLSAEERAGPWKLRITDTVPGQAGYLIAWHLRL
jgi:subtilisin family serine protease